MSSLDMIQYTQAVLVWYTLSPAIYTAYTVQLSCSSVPHIWLVVASAGYIIVMRCAIVGGPALNLRPHPHIQLYYIYMMIDCEIAFK